ncbi:MAG: hypothetical protein HN829_10670 [Candidatus Marinimicrobia bacterium]|nr:hypothetical protein [Candidatus Neomarinimicrobiota bacterium]
MMNNYSFFKRVQDGAILLLLSSFVFSQSSIIQRTDQGVIDYEKRVIVGKGIAKIQLSNTESPSPSDKKIKFAQGSAKNRARNNINNLVKQINYNGIPLGEFMQYDPTIEKRISSYVSSAYQNGEVEFIKDGNIEVAMAISMVGLSEIIFPGVGFAPDKPKSVQYLMTRSTVPKAHRITGIVIDARNTTLKPALAPRIVDENGTPIYGMNNSTRGNAINRGLVGYARSLDSPELKNRIGNNPLIITALNKDYSGSTNPVVSLKSGLEIKTAQKSFHLFDECKVLVLIN